MDKSIEQGESLPARIVDKSYEWLARRGRRISNNKHFGIHSDWDEAAAIMTIFPAVFGGILGVFTLLLGPDTGSMGLIAGALEVPLIAHMITSVTEESVFNKAVSKGRMEPYGGKWNPKPGGK